MDPTELKMVGVSCETDNVYREATFILSPLPEVWVEKKCPPKSRKTPTSFCAAASVHPNPDDFLTSVGSIKRTGVSIKKCRYCGKEFRTTCALNTHLLIHRTEKLHACDICQKVFKQHQFMSHMSTHHDKKTHYCTYSGCHKSYNDRNTLKHHCTLQHGVHIISPSSDRPTSRWEPMDTPAVSKLQSHNTDLRGFVNCKQRPISPHVAKSFSNAEDTYPSQVKRPPSWTLATASKSSDVKEREMLTSTHWAPSVPYSIKENPVVISLNDSDFESGPDSPKFPLPFLQPSKVTATYTVSSSNASESVYSQQHCSMQLKHCLEPLNKLKRKHLSIMCHNAALIHPEPKSGLISDFHPVIATHPSPPVIRNPSPAPLPESRKRKYKSKDSEKVLCDDPAPLLPVPKPSNKHSRTQSPCLVLPSQESTMMSRGQEQDSCKRTYTRRPAVGRTQMQCQCTQGRCGSCEKTEELIPKLCFSTLKDEGQKQKYKRMNSPALIIPDSVPVTQTKAISSKSSPHLDEQSQSTKGLSSRSCRLIPPTISSPLPTPERTNDQETQRRHGCSATRGRPSQLNSPIYLADHRASPRIHPSPYTPPPMLSPHRPRTGLYFNVLLQYQQYPPAPASNYNPTHGNVSLTVDNTVKPRINIGSRFQAEIPPIRNTFYALYEDHPAQVVWSPWKDLTTKRKTQKKVTELLDMCCSSVLTGGGTNIELALHCLHEVQGNIPAALDLLLMREDFRTSGHPLNDYHYTGSDHWTDREKRLFMKALEDHGKDFHKIHNVLQTKSVAQCVEYYYIMKNQKKFKQRVQAADEKDVGKTSVFQDSQKTPPEQKKPKTRKTNTRRLSVQKRCTCEEPLLHLNQDRDRLPPDVQGFI